MRYPPRQWRSARLPLFMLLGLALSSMPVPRVLAETQFQGWVPSHDGSFEADVSWTTWMSPPPSGTGGAFAQRTWAKGTVDSIRVGLHAMFDGPIPPTVTVDVYVWADASGAPGALLRSRLNQVLALPPVPDPNGEGWTLAVGLTPVATDNPWIGVRVRASAAGSATLAVRSDLDGGNDVPPLTNVPAGAPFPSGWQPASLIFGPLAALALEPEMLDLRVAGPPTQGAGGSDDSPVVASGEWSFDRFAEPPLLEACFARPDSVGDLVNVAGWTPVDGSSPSAGPQLATLDGETPEELAAADVEGHALWFYDPLTEAFPAGHEGTWQSPEIDLSLIGMTGGPLGLRVHTRSPQNVPPGPNGLWWRVGSRSRTPGGDWGPWFDVVALVDEGAEQLLVPLVVRGMRVQVRVGVKNPMPLQVAGKGPKADKVKLVKVLTGPPPAYKPIPQLSQSAHKHTCMAMAAAACLAYWAQNGYPELRDSSATTASKNKNLADSLARIMETGEGKKGRGVGGISEWLKRRGVHQDSPGPPPRKKLVQDSFRDTAASWSRMKDHLSRGHDVMLGIKAYKMVNGVKVPVEGSNGPWAHMVTLAEITEQSDGKKSIRVSDPNGPTIQDEKAGDPKKKDANFPPTEVGVDPATGGVTLPATWKSKGAGVIYEVEEVNVVRPDPPNPAPGAQEEPPLASTAPKLMVAPERPFAAASELTQIAYTYQVTAPPDRAISYVAVEIEVPYSTVVSPPGWTWEPLPSLPPGAVSCEGEFGPRGIAWRSLGADIPPGTALAGFGFEADAAYPAQDDALDWLASSPSFIGSYFPSSGPGLPPPVTGAPPPPSRLTAFGAVPTPARHRVQVLFASPVAGRARAVWLDAQGREHASREFEVVRGRNRLDWDRRATDGRRLAAGVYFCRIQVGDEASTTRVVLVGN